MQKPDILEKTEEPEAHKILHETTTEKPAEVEDVLSSVSPSKPVLLKNLGFFQTSKLPEKRLEKLAVEPKEPSTTLSPDIPGKAMARPGRVHEKMVQKPTTTTSTQTLIPIMSAIGLLAGSKAISSPSVTSIKTIPEKHMAKTPITNRIDQTPIKSVSKVPSTEHAISLSKPITPDELATDTEETSATSATSLGEPIETTTEIQPVLDRTPAPESSFESEMELPKLEPTKEPGEIAQLNWLPIATAMGYIGNLATSASLVDLQSKKDQLGYEPTIIPEYIEPTQMKSDFTEIVDIKGTITKPPESARELRKIDLLKPEADKALDSRVPELLKTEQVGKSGEIPTEITGSIHLTIPKPGAIDTLDNIARRTQIPKRIMIKLIPSIPTGIEPGRKPDSDLKRISTDYANLPKPAGLAIKDLNLGAIISRSALFIDKIDAVSITKDKLTIPTKPSMAADLETIKAITTPTLSKTVKPTSMAKVPEIPEKATELLPEHGILIDKSSFGALNQLTTLAIVAAKTAGEAYSYSPTAPTILGELIKPVSETPITGTPETVSSITKGDVEEIKTLRLEPGKIIQKSETETEIGTIDIPTVLAFSASQSTTPKLVLPKSTKEILQTTIESTSRTKGMDKSISKYDYKLMLEKAKEQEVKADLILTKKDKLKSFATISDAINRLQRPEQQLAEYISRSRRFETAATKRDKTETEKRGMEVEYTDFRAAGRTIPEDEVVKKQELIKETREISKKGMGVSDRYIERLPPGALEKVGFEKEYMVNLEDQIHLLREQLKAKGEEHLPSNRKLQEVIHDPNLQTQLKKLFYEAWLENMDKELKRYGE
jgi:hypothetical protein